MDFELTVSLERKGCWGAYGKIYRQREAPYSIDARTAEAAINSNLTGLTVIKVNENGDREILKADRVLVQVAAAQIADEAPFKADIKPKKPGPMTTEDVIGPPKRSRGGKVLGIKLEENKDVKTT